MLALAVVLAGFPGVFAVGVGILGVLAGNDISDSSSSFDDWEYSYDDGYSSDYGYNSGYGSSSGGSLSSDIDQFGAGTVEAGIVSLAVGSVILLAALAAATGNNGGRVLTTLWLLGASAYLLYVLGQAPGGLSPYVLVFLAPPVIALLGLFSPESNRVFRDD